MQHKLEHAITLGLLLGVSSTIATPMSYAEVDGDGLSSTKDETIYINGEAFANVHYFEQGTIKYEGNDTDLIQLPALSSKSLLGAMNYWSQVVGYPKAGLPDIYVYSLNINKLNASASSTVDKKYNRNTVFCNYFISDTYEGTKPAAKININAAYDKWAFTDLSAIPCTTSVSLTNVLAHEMFHALGVSSGAGGMRTHDENNLEGTYDINGKSAKNFSNFLFDKFGHQLNQCDSFYVDDASVGTTPENIADNVFYIVTNSKNRNESHYGGVYFSGTNVQNVLNGATLAWPDDEDGHLGRVSGIPINGIEIHDDTTINIELGHLELQNCLESHQKYRNYGIFTELELAVLQDLGYNIDLRKFYGRSIYNDDLNITNDIGYNQTQDYGIGLHVYGINNDIIQTADINANGTYSVGIRVDGAGYTSKTSAENPVIRSDGNDITIAAGTTVAADGYQGRAINFSYGKNHNLTVNGAIQAQGEGGRAICFDFGDNLDENDVEYRGSYIHTKKGASTGLLAALNGPLVETATINGTVQGKAAAIYISQNAFVKNININSGARITGDIVDDWNKDADFVQLPSSENGMTTITFDDSSNKGITVNGDIYAEETSDDGNSTKAVVKSLNLVVDNVNSAGNVKINGSAMVNSITNNATDGALTISGLLTTNNSDFTTSNNSITVGMLVVDDKTYGYNSTDIPIDGINITGNIVTENIATDTVIAKTIDTNSIEASSLDLSDKGTINYAESTANCQASKAKLGTLSGGGTLNVNADIIAKSNGENFNVGSIDNAKLELAPNGMTNADVMNLDSAKQYIQNNNYTARLANGGSIVAPESLLSGATTWDQNGAHEQRGTNDNLAEAMSPANSMARVDINDIRKRMGDLRYSDKQNGFWLRNENGALSGTGIDSNFHKWQLGADTKLSDKWHFGAALSMDTYGTSFSNGYNKGKGYSGAVYGMYTGKDGNFADIIARYGTVSNELSFAPGGVLQQGKLNQRGVSLSGEIGRTIQLKKDFFVEPQAELTYTKISGNQFISNGNTYSFDGSSSLVVRVGTTFGYHLADKGTIYTRLSGLHEFSGNSNLAVLLSNGLCRPFSYSGKDTWLEWAIGTQFQASNSTYIYADLERTFGANINEDYRLNLGFRVSF